MKKLILFLLFIVSMYANPSIEEIIDDIYQQAECGDDPVCFASKYIIKGIVNIEEAYKLYITKEIQERVTILKKYNENEYNDVTLQVYKKMLDMSLPKINENKKLLFDINGDIVYCNFEFKHTRDILSVEFNNCQSEWHTVIFKQKEGYIEVLVVDEASY